MKQSRKSLLHFMLCFILITGCNLLNQVEEKVPETIEVEDVNITIIDGDYNNQLKIELNTITENAIISYTLDGSTPSRDSGSTYSDPFIVNESGTIKAMAYVDIDGTVIESRIISESFSFKVADPRIIPGGVTFSGTIIVSIISATDDAYIRYTTDGTVPTETIGETYDGSFTLSESATVRAKAYREGFEESDVVYEEFVLDDELPQVSGIIWKGSLSYAPYNPEVNWAYYNTSDGISYIYNGYSWDILAQDGNTGSDGSDGQNGSDGQDGISIIWQGSLDYFPYNPELNWAFYHNVEGISYIYDGYSWNILARDGVIGEDGVDGINGVNGIDGLSIIWKGTYISAPDYPELNWGYYNSSEGISYIWTGSEWSIIAKDGGISSVVAPVMIPGGTTFSVPTLVTMFTTTNEAMIRYTTDGSDPDEYTGQLYSEPLLIEYSTTLKAVAYRDGMNTSPITSMNYIINRVDDPVFDLLGGDFSAIQSVTVTTTTSDATLYYTIDGSNPSSYNYEDYGNNSVTITVDKTMTLRVIAMKDGYIASGVVEEIYNIENVVSPPDFDLAEGYYTTAQTLNITTETEGAIIYYTLNGSTPSSSYYEGSGSSISLDIITAVTVRAIAVKTGWTDSTVTQQTYTITGTVAEPEFTILSGTYVPGTDVQISSPTSGSTIYYTLDGTTPTDINYDGSGYNGVTITLTDSVTINAIAVKDYWDDSILVYEEYVITDSVATPQFDILGGLFNTTQSVVITTDTAGATIYYTIDGTDPSTENYVDFGTDSVNVTVDETMTLKAIAVMDGMPESDISSEVYTIDTVAPVITLLGPDTILIDINDNFSDPGYTATDNVDGDVTNNVNVSGSVDTSLEGVYTLTYNVSDSAGNSANEVTRTVEVLASTVLPLTIRSSTTDFHNLDISRSPYSVVSGNCRIDTGVSVTIEPGVVIKFDPGTQLYVDGELIAVGSENNRITFTAGGADYWNNVEFSNLATEPSFDLSTGEYVSGSTFQYCDFENGGSENDRGMLTVYDTSMYITYCNFNNSYQSGMYFDGSYTETFIVENCHFFENNESGIFISEPLKGRMSFNTLTRNGYYPNGVYSSSRSIRGAYFDIRYSNYHGVVNYQIDNNLFIDSNLRVAAYHTQNIIHVNNNHFEDVVIDGHSTAVVALDAVDNFNNNTITNCYTAISNSPIIAISAVDNFISNNITYCHMLHDTADYALIYMDRVTLVSNNIIVNNISKGYLIELRSLDNKSFISNDISNNNFTGTNASIAVIKLTYYTNNIVMTGNGFVNPNFEYEVEMISEFSGSQNKVDASGSWWGQDNEAFIISRIWDYSDDSNMNIVEYYPWSPTELTFE